MISGEKIAHYISQPKDVEKKDLQELRELVNKYPYSSSFRLLELKGLALANSIDFEEKLKSTAIHVADRLHLYEFIHSGINGSESKTITKEALPEKEAIAVKTEHREEVNTSEQIIKVTDEETILTENKPEGEEDVLIESQIITSSLETIEKIEEKTLADIEETMEISTSELDVDILNKAIDVAFVSSEIAPRTPIEEEAMLEEVSEVQEEIEVEVEPISIAASEEKIDTSNLTFIQWLRIKQERNQLTVKTQEKRPKLPIKEIEPALEVTKIVGEKQSVESKQRKKEIDALLDKFMEEEPRISKPVRDFYSPVKNARKSVEESDDIVTETLAKIHVLQKNYSKAISAYEKLILLYPEKKSFFASRIEKIREESKKR